MPQKLSETLWTHKNRDAPIQQSILVTCFGLSEERRFIENLTRTANLGALSIEYRPYSGTKMEKLNEVLVYHRRLFLDHSRLYSLNIDMTCDNHHRGNDVFQLDPCEMLPSIRTLSLTSYAFEYSWRGLHVNTDVRSLQNLTLDKCKRLDFLFHEFRIRNAQLVALKIRYPIWREGGINRDRQFSIFQRFLDEQQCLETLELLSLGFSSSILSTLIYQGHGKKIHAIHLKDLDSQVRTSTRDVISIRAAVFKSLSANDIRQFRLHCPELRALSIDLAGADFSVVSMLHIDSYTLRWRYLTFFRKRNRSRRLLYALNWNICQSLHSFLSLIRA